LLGGFGQKGITVALLKGKNGIVKTASSTHRHRSEPYDDLLTTLSSGEVNRRTHGCTAVSGKEGRLLKVEDLEAQHLAEDVAPEAK
jgi:hypothetical protein